MAASASRGKLIVAAASDRGNTVPSLQPLPAVNAGSFGVVLIAGKHVCMFRMCGCKSNRAQANEIDHNL